MAASGKNFMSADNTSSMRVQPHRRPTGLRRERRRSILLGSTGPPTAELMRHSNVLGAWGTLTLAADATNAARRSWIRKAGHRVSPNSGAQA